MKLGYFGINVGPCSDPDVAAPVARAAEAAGYDSLWTGEHVVLPDPQAPPSPAPPEMPFLDPAVSLGFLAAETERVLLATGIVILPQRNPVVLAKEFATVDRLSKGRLVLGVAAGYLEAEFQALGADFANRGALTDEYIAAIRTLWTEEKPVFHGDTVHFEGIQSRPLPVQQPHPLIVVGGQSPPALRRAQREGNGWYGFALDLEGTERCLRGLEEAAKAVERPSELGSLEISVTPVPGPIDRDTARRYEDLGVDRLVLMPLAGDAEGLVALVEKSAEELGT
ncbi:MAG: TIGR03619 family F420-dependent LLM class oxidoreductase [Proteobacteria bacterium]|nr:TIGR03619 family F420-dependent LLM class oxidoreductase [Pseudomonadota bacterium]